MRFCIFIWWFSRQNTSKLQFTPPPVKTRLLFMPRQTLKELQHLPTAMETTKTVPTTTSVFLFEEPCFHVEVL